ncbi:hypothetical protein BOX15_Mlig022806g1, partial [Macrostomum lignano]
SSPVRVHLKGLGLFKSPMPITSSSKQKSTTSKKQQNEQQQKQQTTVDCASAIRLCPKSSDLLISVHVRPGAKISQLTELDSDSIGLSITAPPVDGQANAAVVEHLAKMLGCRRSDVDLQSGAKSKDKLLRVAASAGLTVESARQALQLALTKS